MSDKPIIPTADQVIGTALDKFYGLRPQSFQHINLRTGVSWHPFLAYRAQAALVIKRLAALVAANRLSTAEGVDLLEYVASEYEAVAETGRTFAIGEATFSRPATVLAGDIPKGTRLVRAANLTTQIPLRAAEYETLIDAHFDVGQATCGPIPIRAISDGVAANHPIRTDSIPHGVKISSGRLFDPGVTVSAFSAAGGAEGVDDSYVRRFAKAFSKGQYGPTSDASRYGALRSTGARNILVYDLPGTGTQHVLVADANWASSDRWAATVQQSLYDDELVGFGCKVVVLKVRNKVITLVATVRLRDTTFLSETTEVDEAIRKACRQYFDDRSDWNIWKSSPLRAAITRSHPKILHCTSVTVKDVTGATISEITSPDYNAEQFHYFLANNAVSVAYLGPS